MKFSKAKSNAAISSSATIAGGVQSSYPDKHDAKLERKVLRRLDGLFLPLMCSLYLLGFLDRANLGNARVAGLQAKLKITDVQYQLGKPPNIKLLISCSLMESNVYYSCHNYVHPVHLLWITLKSPDEKNWAKIFTPRVMSIMGNSGHFAVESPHLFRFIGMPLFPWTIWGWALSRCHTLFLILLSTSRTSDTHWNRIFWCSVKRSLFRTSCSSNHPPQWH